MKTLEEVVTFYNNGGREQESDPLSPFMSGGIKPLELTEDEQTDLVNFLKSLTSPVYAALATGEVEKENSNAKN